MNETFNAVLKIITYHYPNGILERRGYQTKATTKSTTNSFDLGFTLCNLKKGQLLTVRLNREENENEMIRTGKKLLLSLSSEQERKGSSALPFAEKVIQLRLRISQSLDNTFENVLLMAKSNRN